jgi:hypothetical protein
MAFHLLIKKEWGFFYTLGLELLRKLACRTKPCDCRIEEKIKVKDIYRLYFLVAGNLD